ncbi:hypothetical protein K1T35_48425 (plasmid) [Pseudonocardia sp. DSM 110487]|uniref:hypothetical protein n=1 Tax=Pseudonocardia sp. DSM 110487 TaxID=2865833 RepID=UPI001C69BD77|nr:hypothetical protein [Pseudonocardia sp. DSM 110487]QYN41175.1 hypothetical protein K1T35_48425 [Pseudonocardia sp. DSM 110487]
MAEQEIAAANGINLEVARQGSLATRLTWSGGSGPYDVLIDPSVGSSRYESDIDDTTMVVATEPGRENCFTVFGSDRTESERTCLSS